MRLTYQAWYEEYIVPAPPRPRERVEKVLEALGDDEYLDLLHGIRMAWQATMSELEQTQVAAMAEAVQRGVGL